LVDLNEEPYLTTLVNRLGRLDGLTGIVIVTNTAIKPELDAWARGCPPTAVPLSIVDDGTQLAEQRLGAVGDLIFGIRKTQIQEDLFIVGGDNWVTFDLAAFLGQARQRPPAVVVTRVRLGSSPSRFGWVRMDVDHRIVAFLEHPEAEIPESMFKASCIYYMTSQDLRWLDEFAKECSTVCSPGMFFAWLAGRLPVHGVPMTAFFDIAGAPSPQGPDYLELRNVLRRFFPSSTTWERKAARELLWVTSHLDLINVLEDEDPNKRIVAADLLGRIKDLLSQDGRGAAIQALLPLLEDASPNSLPYGGGFESDEESITYVSATAANSLVQLGYATDNAAVYERAQQHGVAVRVTRNRL
jgi:glucose-1-phosphate thymidylyltransferase